jgi:hypothetical protein
MPTAWTIIEYPGRDGLMRLHPDWTRLVAAMPDAGFQHLHETHLSYLDKLPSKFGAFTCLALSDGTSVRAICPVEPQRIAIFRLFESPVWGLPQGLGDVTRDLICPPDPEAEAALLPCIVEHLSRTRTRRPWLVLTRVLDGSGAWRCLRGLDARRYCADADNAAHMIDCDRPYASLLSGLSRNSRRSIRSAHNRVAKLADVRFVRTVDAADIDAALGRFLQVEASGWKGASGARTAVALNPEQVAFYRNWVASLGASGVCEFNELRVGDVCLASTLCIRVAHQCTILKIGYDERFAKTRPGHLILERIFQQCCEDPAIKRVSLVSCFEWVRVWQPEVVQSYNAYLGIGGWPARARVALLRMKFLHWPVLKRWLQRSGFGGRIARRAAGQSPA